MNSDWNKTHTKISTARLIIDFHININSDCITGNKNHSTVAEHATHCASRNKWENAFACALSMAICGF